MDKKAVMWVEAGSFKWLVGSVVCAIVLGLFLIAFGVRAAESDGYSEYKLRAECLKDSETCTVHREDLAGLIRAGYKLHAALKQAEARCPALPSSRARRVDHNPMRGVWKRL